MINMLFIEDFKNANGFVYSDFIEKPSYASSNTWEVIFDGTKILFSILIVFNQNVKSLVYFIKFPVFGLAKDGTGQTSAE